MTLNGIMAVILRYFKEFVSFWVRYVAVVEVRAILCPPEKYAQRISFSVIMIYSQSLLKKCALRIGFTQSYVTIFCPRAWVVFLKFKTDDNSFIALESVLENHMVDESCQQTSVHVYSCVHSSQ